MKTDARTPVTPLKPGVERVDAYTIRKVTDDPLELLP
jgi:hypothetical protein